MANLVVRNIDDELVRVLKSRAGLHGISAEAEHRKILRAVLLRPKKKSFSAVLQSIPAIGKDSDFDRKQDDDADKVAKDVFA